LERAQSEAVIQALRDKALFGLEFHDRMSGLLLFNALRVHTCDGTADTSRSTSAGHLLLLERISFASHHTSPNAKVVFAPSTEIGGPAKGVQLVATRDIGPGEQVALPVEQLFFGLPRNHSHRDI
jgi:hypothetical protein